MRTRLTWLQEKGLQNYFGGKKFSLLYKASVQNFLHNNLLNKCWNNGPNMMVLYSGVCILGAYVQEGFQKKDVSITLFALRETGISEFKTGPYLPSELFYDNEALGLIPDFFIKLEEKEVIMSSEICEKLGLTQRLSTVPIHECEVFQCQELLDERKRHCMNKIQNSLLHDIRSYKPHGHRVPQTRILLLGPVGAGKSSFFNSVKSVFSGHVTHQALVGSAVNGISNKYRTYSIIDKSNGDTLPFVLCDSLGLSQEAGLHMDDIDYILKGHTPDRYQFNSMKPITSNDPNYIHRPLLKDRIHCVAFVFDANSVDQLSSELVAKIKQVRREMRKCGMLHVALLTQVDSVDLITKGDLIDIYNCEPVKLKLQAVHRDLGFALSDILVVSNYVSEWQLNPVKDVLILLALREMLWTADDFLEDLPLNEEEEWVLKHTKEENKSANWLFSNNSYLAN